LPKSKITEKIKKDAESEAQEIIKKAEQKTQEILNRAKKEKKEIEDETKKLATRTKKREIEKALSNARMQSRKKILREKRNIIDSVFRKTKEKMLSQKKKQYVEFISNLIKQEVKDVDFTLVLAENDVQNFGEGIFKEILKNLDCDKEIPFEKGDFSGGCILRRESYEFNATMDTIINKTKEELESEIAKMLFK
jgi:V/A-type H+-transporting ATPase subunit E